MSDKARADIHSLIEILSQNHGQGYFDTTHLPWAPAVWTDAMKDAERAGWGWCCENGEYDWGIYSSTNRRRWIDELEGDAVEPPAAVVEREQIRLRDIVGHREQLLGGALGRVPLEHHLVQVPLHACLLYTSPSPRDYAASRMPSSA